MKLDEIADDVGLDVNGEALLARGEQLVKLEVSFLHSLRVNLWNVDFNTVHFFLSLNGRKCGVKCELFFFTQADALDDRKTTIYNLQRRLKWSKQQMESKDLHLGLLKKKVSELEELLREKGRVEVERDENSIRYKKLVKHNDKLQRELLDYKQQVTNLKAKLLEASELRVSVVSLLVPFSPTGLEYGFALYGYILGSSSASRK